MVDRGYYYVLGEGTRMLESSGFPWPYGVEYNPSDVENPFILWEGVAHGAVAGSFSARYILEQNFNDHFRITDTEWLIPILHRIAAGERVSTEEIFAAYRGHHHGAEPRRRDF